MGPWLLLAGLLGLSAWCSATEAAMLSINKVRLRHLAEEGHRAARETFRLLPQLDRVIGTLLVANNLVNMALAAVTTWLCVSWFGPEEGVVIAAGGSAIAVLLVGEVAPKTFAANYPERVIFATVWPLRLAMVVLAPLAAFFTTAARWLLRGLGIATRKRSPLVTEEEIKVMIQMGREAGVLGEGELRMLQRIFEFTDSVVREIMVPRAQIVGVDLASKPEAVLDILIEEGHSRIPVYRGSVDEVLGVIYARDVLATVRHGGLFALQDLIRPIAAVGPQKRLAELLGEFQRDKTQIAIVRDPQGATLGLVTIEDLLEEIVGEIREEVPDQKTRKA
jgi:CBS domain containing-hemolysin-like protein